MQVMQPGPRRYVFDDVVLDQAGFRVWKAGQVRHLQPRGFDVLLYLIRHRDRVVDKQELFNIVWHGEVVTDNALSRAVKEVRHAIGDDAGAPRYIETVQRRGYRFIAQLEADAGDSPPAALRVVAPARRSMRSLGLRVAGLAAAGVLLIAAGVWYATPYTAKSIALLPLEISSQDSSQEFFADGMTSALIADFGSIPGVRVISRSSVLRYKGRPLNIAEAAGDLKAEALLTGSVERSGRTVRIALELHDAKSGRRIWRRQWESDASRMPAMQREIATTVAARIGARFVPGTGGLPAAAVNQETYDAYLRGRHAMEQWPRGLWSAAEYFQKAIEKDPGFAPAHAALALTFSNLCYFSPPREVAARAVASAREALRLDPSAAEAHLALGITRLIHDWDWTGAERDLLKAIEINPSSATAHLFYANYLASMGRVDQSILEAREARRVDPNNKLCHLQVAWAYMLSRRYEDAIREYSEILKAEPDYELARAQLGWCYTLMGRYPEARQAFSTLELGADAMLIYLDAVSGRRKEALAGLRELLANAGKRYEDPYAIAIAYAGLGDRDRAFAMLDKGLAERSAQVPQLKVEPFFDPLRADPRFDRLLARLNLQ